MSRLTMTAESESHHLVDGLLSLVLTIFVSNATTKRAFSTMTIIKTSLHNKIEDDFLTNYIIVFIEKEIAKKVSTDMIIADFYKMKELSL